MGSYLKIGQHETNSKKLSSIAVDAISLTVDKMNLEPNFDGENSHDGGWCLNKKQVAIITDNLAYIVQNFETVIKHEDNLFNPNWDDDVSKEDVIQLLTYFVDELVLMICDNDPYLFILWE